MLISTADELARCVRDQRRKLGMTQAALAESAGVSRRWLSALEAGKATAELGLVLATLSALDLVIDVQALPADARPFSLDDVLRDHRSEPR